MFTKKLIGLVAMLTIGSAHAAIISDNTVSGSITNTFEGLGAGAVSGLIVQTGATYGERLQGQTLSVASSFDTLSGTPTAPLTVFANAVVNDNIGILSYTGSNRIYGDLNATVGEGAVSILFATPTDLLGFDVVGTNDGGLTVDFFGSAGNLLGSLSQLSISDTFYGFRATAGEQIAAVSITNTDPGGIAYDNFTFNASAVAPVSVPGSLPLIGVGLAALGGALRRKQS